ncbi:MAG: hypothetical protein ACFBSC_22630 [Microcoleaceae cyanobacterium]
MASAHDDLIEIQIQVNSQNPALLDGIESWLRLGLITDEQVKLLCQKYLSQPLTAAPVRSSSTRSNVTESAVAGMTATGPEEILNQHSAHAIVSGTTDSSRGSSSSTSSTGTGRHNFFARLFQAFKDEFSVRWLLFLGLFTVLLSSGLLAASQWERFPAIIQYGVLFSYTLGFFIATFWIGKQENLALTTETLRLVTLLLVPLNFWAIDEFALWKSSAGWIIIGLCAVVLTGVVIILNQTQRKSPQLFIANQLGLSYLHLGWQVLNFPLIAIYLGSMLTSLLTGYRLLKSTDSPESHAAKLSPLLYLLPLSFLIVRATSMADINFSQLGFALATISGLLYLETTLLLHRLSYPLFFLAWFVSLAGSTGQALLVNGIGLGIFIDRLRNFWQPRELVLIFLLGGQSFWLLSHLIPDSVRQGITATFVQLTQAQFPTVLQSLFWLPYLVIMVGIVDWLYHRQKRDLVKLGDRLTLAFGSCLTVFSTANPIVQSLNLLASSLILGLVTLRRRPHNRIFLIYLTHLGALLTILSLLNNILPNLKPEAWGTILAIASPLELILFFALFFALFSTQSSASTAQAATVPDSTPQSSTAEDSASEDSTVQHLSARNATQSDSQTGEVSSSFPHRQESRTSSTPLPNRSSQSESLNQQGSAQSSVPVTNAISTVANSAWYFGLALAGVSYVLFWMASGVDQDATCLFRNCANFSPWSRVSWVLVPLTLTAIGTRPRSNPKQTNKQTNFKTWAYQLGFIFALFSPPVILGPAPVRLVGLGIGTVLMFVNSLSLRTLTTAAVTVGAGLGFSGLLIGEVAPDLSVASWLVVLAVHCLLLWSIRYGLTQASRPLARLYQTATDNWAFVLCGFGLISLTAYIIAIYWQLLAPKITILAAILLLLVAIVGRRCIPTNRSDEETIPISILSLYGMGWSLELLLAFGLNSSENRLLYLSIANVFLGLFIQLIGEYWQRRNSNAYLTHPWQVLPLFYGIFGVALRSQHFDNWTGLSVLGFGLILLGVGRHRPALKPLVYLGLAGISVAAYQLLINQVLALPIGQQLVASAALGTTLVYAYRVLTPWLMASLQLSEPELITVAHLHWGLSSFFLIAATFFPLDTSQWLALGTGVFLARYAMFQGRRRPNSVAAEIWVYIGALEAIAILLYVADLLNLPTQLIPWASAIVSGVAYFIYFLPWQSWGWSMKPWRKLALFLPLATVGITAFLSLSGSDSSFNTWDISTVLTALFYLILARFERKIRLTYFSLALVNFVLLHRLSVSSHDLSSLAEAATVGGSLLYLAQLEPYLRSPKQKDLRHWIRVIGTGVICATALFTVRGNGIIPGLISLGAIFAGLGLRIRAFLYVGTAIFMMNLLNQMVILNSIYPFFKWIVGLMLGLILFWIGANFETRRSRIITLLQGWLAELERWE